MTLDLDARSSASAANASDAYWHNPAAEEAQQRLQDGATVDATTAPAAPGPRNAADAATVDIQGTASGTALPSGRTPDGKEIATTRLHDGDGVAVTRERTLADAGGGQRYVSSDQVVFTTGTGNDDVRVTQRDDGTLDVSVNDAPYAVRLGQGQELTLRVGAGDDVVDVAANVRVNIVVDGGAGDDTITTGAGNDRIDGGSGNDTIRSGAGRDDVFGNTGNDTIDAGAGDDVVHGGDGDDILAGGAGNDFVEGGAGRDQLDGGAGNDILSGGRGDDALRGGAGDDRVYTGEGVDTVDNAGGADVVYGQSAVDLVRAAATASNTVVNVEIDAAAGTRGITLQGSDAFVQRVGAELDMLRASPNGQRMLAEFDVAAATRGNSVTIRELANEQNGYAQTFSGDADIVNGRAGAGGDVTISYNPSFHLDVFQAPAVVLYHEMSHAWNGVTGTFQPGTYRGDAPDSGRVPNAERQAVGLESSAPPFDFDGDPATPPTTTNPDHLTENGFREELGLPDRPSYAL